MSVWVYQFRLFDIGIEFKSWWWAWILCFFLDDLAYYAFHRSAHRVRWFWASHVIHHSSQHYNLSTALRQTWTGFFSLTFLFRLPLFLIGFPPAMVFFCAGLNLIYQFWIHTEAIKRLPKWFEAVMNTPSHHRVHHGVNPRYLDANYAGVFIIWDKMFGSFVAERDDEPVRYGIVKQLGSFNILWAAVHEWVGIAKDVWAAPWKHKLAGIGIGFGAIQLLNLVRIISLFYLGQWNRTWFDWFHLYLWQALIMLDALVVFLLWLRWLPRPAPVARVDGDDFPARDALL